MDHIENNRDAFEPYMEDDESFDDYMGRMRGDAEWGGHQELVAASQLYEVRRWSKSMACFFLLLRRCPPRRHDEWLAWKCCTHRHARLSWVRICITALP